MRGISSFSNLSEFHSFGDHLRFIEEPARPDAHNLRGLVREEGPSHLKRGKG
jgi:hypothetical protein